MLDEVLIKKIKRITLENFFINKNIIKENYPELDESKINEILNFISTSFRKLEDNNFTLFSEKEYNIIKKLTLAKKRGHCILIEGRKKNNDPFCRKGCVDGFVITKNDNILVRIYDIIKSRYSNFYINKIKSVKILPSKKLLK